MKVEVKLIEDLGSFLTGYRNYPKHYFEVRFTRNNVTQVYRKSMEFGQKNDEDIRGPFGKALQEIGRGIEAGDGNPLIEFFLNGKWKREDGKTSET